MLRIRTFSAVPIFVDACFALRSHEALAAGHILPCDRLPAPDLLCTYAVASAVALTDHDFHRHTAVPETSR